MTHCTLIQMRLPENYGELNFFSIAGFQGLSVDPSTLGIILQKTLARKHFWDKVFQMLLSIIST